MSFDPEVAAARAADWADRRDVKSGRSALQTRLQGRDGSSGSVVEAFDVHSTLPWLVWASGYPQRPATVNGGATRFGARVTLVSTGLTRSE